MDSVRLAGAIAASGLLCAPVGASVPAASAAPAPAAAAAPGPGPAVLAAEGSPAAATSEGSPNTRQIVVGVGLAGGALLGMAGLALHRRRTARPPAPRERADAPRPRESSGSRAGPPGTDGAGRTEG